MKKSGKIAIVEETYIKVIMSVEVELIRKEATRPARDWDTLKPLKSYWAASFMGSIYEIDTRKNNKKEFIAGGQCRDTMLALFDNYHIKNIYPPNLSAFFQLLRLWREWHLNDMQPGTKRQQAALAPYGDMPYKTRCILAKELGVHDDKGYKYGSEWLIKPIPASVRREILDTADAAIFEGGEL